MDPIGTMRDWKEGNWLFDKIAVDRPDIDRFDLAPQDSVLTIDSIDASSTMVRARLAAGQRVDDLVVPAVNDILTTY